MRGEPGPPPLLATDSRDGRSVRVAAGLVLFGAADFVAGVAGMVLAARAGDRINLLAPFSGGFYWVVAWLVWRGKGPIWAFLAWLSAIGVGALLALPPAVLTLLPPKLLSALAHDESIRFFLWFYAGYGTVAIVFHAWVLRECLRRPGRPAGAPLWPESGWLHPARGVVYSLVLNLGLMAAIAALLRGGWTEPVIARARAEYGADHDYLVTQFSFRSSQGRTANTATVIVYDENRLRMVRLAWED